MNLPAFRFRPLLLLGAVALVLASCDGGPTWNEEDPAIGPTGDVVVPKTTNVLDESMVEESLQSEAQGRFGELPDELVFSGDAPMGDVEVGDIIVTGVSEKTPAGFLRKVTGRREEGGQVILETRQGTLSEAIDRGQLDTSITISERTIDQQRLYEEIGARGGQSVDVKNLSTPTAKSIKGFCSGSQDSICFQLTRQIEVQKGPATGTVTYGLAQSYKPSIDVQIDVGLSGVDRVNFEVERGYRRLLGTVAEVNVDTTLSRDIIGDKRLTTFTVFVGPVPVVFSPYIRAEGGVELSLNAKGLEVFSQVRRRSLDGLRYDGSSWERLQDRAEVGSTTQLNWLTKLQGRASPFVRVPLTLRVYEVAGPFVGAKGFAGLQLSATENPLWEMYLGVAAEVGFEAPPVDVEKVYPVAAESTLIASGDEPQGDPPALLFPPDRVESQAGDEQVTISWAGSDAAEEYHVFRAEENFGAPLVQGSSVATPLLSITRVNDDPLQDTTYTDEGLENGKEYYYRVTAVDEEDSGTEGSEMVTGTPLPDPPDRP